MICDKISYKTLNEAHDHITGINKRKGGSYSAYKCDECKMFHIKSIKNGNKNKKNTRTDNRNNNCVNQKSINPVPKISVIQKSIQTTYKPFEYLKNK